MAYVVVFLFGLAVGSFLNVCIRRLPQGLSIVSPASRCPHCQTPIKPYDNIPLLSYVLLRGKCRACRAPISLLYPVVEFATALLFLACAQFFGLTAVAAKWAVFSALIIVLVITDIRERILPDKVNLTGFILAILFSFLAGPEDGTALRLADWLFASLPPARMLWFGDAVLGAALGAGLLWVFAEGYLRLRGREGMGLGDVKMMAMVGAFLGLKKTFLTILLGSLLGSIIGLLIIAVGRKDTDYELPFGTFLGAAALLVVFYGTWILEKYAAFFA